MKELNNVNGRVVIRDLEHFQTFPKFLSISENLTKISRIFKILLKMSIFVKNHQGLISADLNTVTFFFVENGF